MDEIILPRSACRIKVPARTSISVIDTNTFAPGVAGGGNLGFAIDYYSEIQIESASFDQVSFGQDIPEIRQKEIIFYTKYVLESWRVSHREYQQYGFAVHFLKITESHIGVASFASIFMCLICGLNWLNGSLISDVGLRRLLAQNYLEVINSQLSKGFTTGLSSFLNLYGGFGVVDETLRLKSLVKVPNWDVFLVKNRELVTRSYGEIETETLMGQGRDFDKLEIDKKWQLISSIIAFAEAKDLRGIGREVFELQRIGSKKSEISIYGSSIRTTLDDIYDHGLECAFLSAVGPGVVVMTENREFAIEIINKKNLEIIHRGSIDNTGILIQTI